MEGRWCNFVLPKVLRKFATSKLIGILFKLNEIPSKHSLLPMAGLDRKVYLRILGDYKGVGALKSCIFIRSFITSLWCGFHIEKRWLAFGPDKPRAVAFFIERLNLSDNPYK